MTVLLISHKENVRRCAPPSLVTVGGVPEVPGDVCVVILQPPWLIIRDLCWHWSMCGPPPCKLGSANQHKTTDPKLILTISPQRQHLQIVSKILISTIPLIPTLALNFKMFPMLYLNYFISEHRGNISSVVECFLNFSDTRKFPVLLFVSVCEWQGFGKKMPVTGGHSDSAVRADMVISWPWHKYDNIIHQHWHRMHW